MRALKYLILAVFIAGCGIDYMPMSSNSQISEPEILQVKYSGTNIEKATQAYKNKDCASSMKFLNLACDDDEMQACYQLGHMYQNGKCTGANLAKAREFYEKGCAKDHMNSCANLSGFYKDGKGGVEQDYEKAFELAKKACEDGIARACNNVGYFYWKGQGVDLDRTMAKEYFANACKIDPDAQYCKNKDLINDDSSKQNEE